MPQEMSRITIHARFTQETLKEAWWSCLNALIRIVFFVYIILKPMAYYLDEVWRVGLTHYPWDWGDLVIPFVFIVVLYPIIPLVASLRCSIAAENRVLHICTAFREVTIPFDQMREEIWLTKQRLYSRRGLFPMKNWYLVVPKNGVTHVANDPAYCIGPFWNIKELEEAIEKINRIR